MKITDLEAALFLLNAFLLGWIICRAYMHRKYIVPLQNGLLKAFDRSSDTMNEVLKAMQRPIHLINHIRYSGFDDDDGEDWKYSDEEDDSEEAENELQQPAVNWTPPKVNLHGQYDTYGRVTCQTVEQDQTSND